jgi:S-DNA-T family DNA segregation ATPase FtsK/SpoIIIE
VLLGVADGRLEPVALDLRHRDNPLLVLSAGGGGRTTTMRTLLDQLHGAPVDVVLIDPRRGLREYADLVSAYAASPTQAQRCLELLAARLRRRRPPDELDDEVTSGCWLPEQEVRSLGIPPLSRQTVLVIDDYDLLGNRSPGLASPLDPLLDVIPFAREVGLSLVLARNAAAARAGFDPGWQSVSELGGTCLQLSEDPPHGAAGGVRLHRRSRPRGRGQLVRQGQEPILMQVALPGRGVRPRPPKPVTTPPSHAVLGGSEASP